MSEFKIEKGVPLPVGAGTQGHAVYPFRQMEVGDSFFVPNPKPNTVHSAVGSFKKRNPEYRFAVRNQDGGVRVWRISAKGNKP